jgi:hypothetical protein
MSLSNVCYQEVEAQKEEEAAGEEDEEANDDEDAEEGNEARKRRIAFKFYIYKRGPNIKQKKGRKRQRN